MGFRPVRSTAVQGDEGSESVEQGSVSDREIVRSVRADLCQFAREEERER